MKKKIFVKKRNLVIIIGVLLIIAGIFSSKTIIEKRYAIGKIQRADEPVVEELEGWEINTVFYDSTVNDGKTPLTEINWDASDGGYGTGATRTITTQIHYKNTNIDVAYDPGDIEITIPNLVYGNSWQGSSNINNIFGAGVAQIDATILVGANDSTHIGYDWNYVSSMNPKISDENLSFRNANKIEEKTNFEGTIQIIYTITPSAEYRQYEYSQNQCYIEKHDAECEHEYSKSTKATIKVVNSNVFDKAQVVTSPNYPNSYTSSMEKEVKFAEKKDTYIYFYSTSQTYTYDYIKIYDQNNKVLFSLSGSGMAGKVFKVENADYIRIALIYNSSYYSETRMGFKAIVSQDTIAVNMLESNELKFNYYRKYIHPWTNNPFKISCSPYKITSFDNLPSNYSDYIWVKYNYYFNYNCSYYPYIGINNNYSITTQIKSNFPKDCVICSESGEVLTSNENDEYILCQGKYADGNRSYCYSKSFNMFVGYPRSTYNETNNNLKVDNTVEYWGIYANKDEFELITSTKTSINLAEFEFSYSGDLYSISKSSGKEMRYQDIIKNNVYNKAEWTHRINAYYTGSPMTIKFGDDILYTINDKEEIVKVEDNEYNFTKITFDFTNGNSVDIKDEKYDCELWLRYEGEKEYTLYEQFKNKYKSYDLSTIDKKVVGYYFIVYDMKESLVNWGRAEGKYYKRDIPQNGKLYNFSYIEIYFRDDNGNLVKQNEVDENTYSNEETKKLIAQYDKDTYNHYMQRAVGIATWKYYDAYLQTKLASGYKKAGSIVQDAENENFKGSFNIGAYFSSNWYSKAYQDLYDKNDALEGFVIYDLLPKGMDLTSTKDEIINSCYASREMSGSTRSNSFIDTSFQTLTSKEVSDMLKQHTEVEITENWNNTGRTRLKIEAKFPDSPFWICYIGETEEWGESPIYYKYNYSISYDSFLEYGNEYKNYCYADLISENEGEHKYTYPEYIEKLYNKPASDIYKDSGYYDKDAADINENGSTDDYIVPGNATATISYVISTIQGLNVKVQTNKSNYNSTLGISSNGTEYTYKLKVSTGNNNITDLVIYDTIEELAKDDKGNIVNSYGSKKHWKGTFEGIDTTYAKLQGYNVKVWYSENISGGTLTEDNSWKEYTDDIDSSIVKSVAFQFLDENGNSAIIPNNSFSYVLIKMKSPEADLTDEDLKAYAYNGSWTEWNAIDDLGNKVGLITGINSNIVQVSLKDSFDLNVKKNWNDSGNQLELRPEKIEIKLLQNGIEYKTADMSKDENWEVVFEDVPIVNDINEQYKYTIEETPVNLYTTTSIEASEDERDFTITNTLNEDELNTKVYGNKVWNDNENEKNNRPEKITVNLMQDGNKIASKEIDESTNWEYEFTNLSKWKSNTEEHNYTIEEVADEKYDTQIKEVQKNGLKIKFNANSKTESTSYDYVYIYYKKDDKTYRCGPYGGTTIANQEVIIPSNEFYLYWRTDGSNCNYYGFSIDSIEKVEAENIENTTASLPNYTITELEDGQYPESEHTYQNNTNKIWHYIDKTPEREGKQIEITNTYKEIPAQVIVHHYKEGTEEKLADDETIDGMVWDAYTTQQSADVPKYYEVVETPANATGEFEENTIEVTYYYRLKSYKYNIEYYYNNIKDDSKTEELIAKYDDEITTYTDKILNGYILEKVEKLPLKIGTDEAENIIKVYYIKRSDLNYKVNYLEKSTNKVLSNQKVVENMTFEDEITSANEVIAINGYNYDSVDKDTLIIGTSENVINIYYTKRNDLSYKVNYLEKDTNKVLHEQKVVENMTFEDEILSANEVIAIDGYNYDSVDKDTLTIGTGENVINIYYTKRTDLSYKVNYLEKTTNKVLHEQKVVENMTFEDEVTSANEVIAINGYNYDSVDKETLVIGTSENVINIYYTKRVDLSYTVNYLESVTNNVLHEPKVQTGMTFEDKVNAEDEVIDIDGYNYDYPDKYELVIGTDENVINIYYSKVTGLSYTVNYLEKGTNQILFPSNNQGNMTFGDVINSSDEVITIDGYNFNSFDKDTLTIGTGENVINIYYTKRTDLSYKVNYLEKDTNNVLHEQKLVENMTFEDEITSANEVIEIDGYNYNSVDKATLKITTGENVINIYYTKRNDLSYKVNYLEKDTNKVLHGQKVVENMTFEDKITSANEVITIDGYNYDSVDKVTLKITTGENVINIYYTKKNDLSYKVNYLEKTTNKVLHDQKVVENMRFEDEITSANEVITIDGYNYDSVDKTTLKITTGENVINIYYTKRNDLSYKVNYLEKDTNKVLHEQKVVENMTFEDEITSANEVIAINGYNYDSVDKATLKITTGENVINIYYTKRNNLSYTVNYLEKNTNKVIHAPKVTGNMTFEDEITSADEIITINGYSYDSVDKDKLVITTGENTINIYYTKINGLAYTVNYLEKDTDKVIHTPKTTDNMTFEDEVTSEDEVIEIDGYNYDSVDKDTLVIGTGENIINIYYTKRNDLSYKVNYLEKDTNKVIHDQKVVENVTFEDEITSANEVIEIDGYNYDSVDKDTLVIGTNENIINIYYTKRNNLSYKVNYLEKDTNKVIHDQKVVENVTFEDEITSANEVITIYGYNYDSLDKEVLKISTGENVINIYYTKKEAKVTVHYYEENSTNKVSEDKEITGKVNDEYTTAIADDIPSKYELVATPANATGTMTEDTIEVIYYFRKKATQVIVRHYEEGTTIKLSEDVTIDGRIDDPYTTEAATDVPIKYELSVIPANANGTMTEDMIEVIYYYRVKDAVLNIRYLEKGTEKELAQPEQQHGKVDEEYITGAKTIDGYTLVEHSGNERGRFEVNPLTVTYYYLYNTRATVQYIDKITGQILEQSTTEGLEGDDFVTESKSFDNYILVEEPAQKTVKMTKEEQVLRYYYIHVSGGVIEKHIDMISGEILSNDTHQGNEGDLYDIKSKIFNNYDLVEDRLPGNAQGTMTVNPIEVIYYYIYKSKVTAQYVDKNTGEKLTEDEVQNGHEKDAYITDRKTFDDYKLVEVPANADGEMTKEDITVTYNYVHTSGGVIVNHLDINTGKQLLDETKQEGYEGDPYETHEENIPGYTLVKEKYPENAQGTMKREETRVTYYYVKNTEVNIKYIDKETGEEITEKTNIPGKEGDNYTTEPKDIPGYDLVEEPTNKDGTMTAEPIDVVYYYRRPAKVITRYIDQETNEEIATEERQEGHQNDEYTTEAKDIKYYKLIATPDNATGTMKVTVTKDENGKDIVEDTTYVTYYYRKLIFNLTINKKVSSVTVNGEESIINGDLGKVEVHRKELNTAKVEVKYIIKVTNDSELTGKASILEDIPTGMTMNVDKNAGWEVKGTTATRETKELQPGESEEYIVVLDWENGENNIGMKENTASIISTENEAGFEEKDTTDNEDKADVIVAIGTGGHTYVLIAGGMLLILISLACGVYIIKKND